MEDAWPTELESRNRHSSSRCSPSSRASSGCAFYRCNAKKTDDDGRGDGSGSNDRHRGSIKKQAGGGSDSPRRPRTPIRTASRRSRSTSFEPATPAARGARAPADYKKLGTPRVVKFAVNVWAGWAPIIWANQGAKPKKVWKDAKGNDFQVELVLADNPVDDGQHVRDRRRPHRLGHRRHAAARGRAA